MEKKGEIDKRIEKVNQKDEIVDWLLQILQINIFKNYFVNM